MSDPFRLMDTDIFRTRGHFLFRDVRTWVSEKTSHYTQQLRELLAHFHPDCPGNISKPRLESPPFTGWSYSHGESALVLFDKARSHDALAILEEMVGPRLIDTTKRHVWGDKESYWQAVALAGHEPGMHTYCSPGAVPMPTYVLDAIHAFKLSYHRTTMES